MMHTELRRAERQNVVIRIVSLEAGQRTYRKFAHAVSLVGIVWRLHC